MHVTDGLKLIREYDQYPCAPLAGVEACLDLLGPPLLCFGVPLLMDPFASFALFLESVLHKAECIWPLLPVQKSSDVKGYRDFQCNMS